jgi:hypothetical protein
MFRRRRRRRRVYRRREFYRLETLSVRREEARLFGANRRHRERKGEGNGDGEGREKGERQSTIERFCEEEEEEEVVVEEVVYSKDSCWCYLV